MRKQQTRVEYIWGKDVSGTRDGAAGIGGLLYQKRDGAIYVPWYVSAVKDAEGYLAEYISFTYKSGTQEDQGDDK